ncbi:hypothetical protein DV738_g515, partial [Chaetothyriales sp. CBS 135597]
MGSAPPFTPPSISHLSQVAYLVGDPIAHSSSPSLHEHISTNTGVPYGQVLVETRDLDGFLAYLRSHPTSPKLLGSGVTMPHKVTVIPRLDGLTPEAAAVGAVNTIFLQKKENENENEDPSSEPNKVAAVKLIGHNTDTIGVRDAFLNNSNSLPAVLDPASAFSPPALVVSAVPDFTPSTDAERVVRQILTLFLKTAAASNGGGVLLEMCYHPSPDTEISRLALENGWQVIGGIEAMVAQGCAQSQLWTGVEVSEAVRNIARDEVRKRLQQQHQH